MSEAPPNTPDRPYIVRWQEHPGAPHHLGTAHRTYEDALAARDAVRTTLSGDGIAWVDLAARVQEQHRTPGTRRYALTLEVSPDPAVGGYVATEQSYEPGDPIGRGPTPREAIADWLVASEDAGREVEGDFVEVGNV